jgi:hypothetical protein
VDGSPLTSAVAVGQPISYVVRLPTLSQGSDARIGKCWANDGVSQIDLSNDQGCSVQVTISLVLKFTPFYI